MSKSWLASIPIQNLPLWEKMKNRRKILSFELEITARCNNNCRHCYINLPAGDAQAKSQELTLGEIDRIADEAVSLGAFWVLITGGEPLLREDFIDIYLALKKKGLLVSVFTNATLIKKQHVELFKAYPPRDIEVTIYGVTPETYERVTRHPGAFTAFSRSLKMLLDSGVRIRCKTMALRSNLAELSQISTFCHEVTKDYFRFDPFLHLRYDGNTTRNAEIEQERLTPEEIVSLERADPHRFQSLQKSCEKLIRGGLAQPESDHLFLCSTGNGSFVVGYDGTFRLCSSLWPSDCICDLRQNSLADALNHLVPRVRDLRSRRKEFLEKCRSCRIVDLCLGCPAHSFLETGQMDSVVDYFCRVAHARAEALQENEWQRVSE